MPFISNTDADRRAMLAAVGMKAEELFADIPAAVRDPAMDVPAGLSEQEVRGQIGELAAGAGQLSGWSPRGPLNFR